MKKGRPKGTTKGRIKIGVTVSKANAEWPKQQPQKSAAVDQALDAARMMKDVDCGASDDA